MVKILIVEDSAFERGAIKNLLGKLGYKETVEAANGDEGIEQYKKEKPDLVMIDIRMPGMSGLEMLRKIKGSDPNVKAIVISIVSDKAAQDEAKKLGVKAYIIKPVTQEKLKQALA